MLEKEIERRGREYAETKGQAEYKFVSPGHTGVPDRLKLAPVPLEMQEVVARFVRFVEYKREGEVPTAIQLRAHKRLRDMGFTVEVVDTVEKSKVITDEMSKPL